MVSLFHNFLTNTFFKHKPIHQTTWESPRSYKNVIDSKTGKIRKNPYRNQIDYIIVRNTNKIKIQDSKSTIDKVTKSDHKPVIIKTNLTFKQKHKKTDINKKIDYNRLNIPEVKKNFKLNITEMINSKRNELTNS